MIQKDQIEINLELFDPFKATEEEWNDLHDYRKRYYYENVPDLPLINDETYVERIKAIYENANGNYVSYEVTYKNKQIGALGIRINQEGTKLDFNLKLLQAFRRQGIESNILDKYLKWQKRKKYYF